MRPIDGDLAVVTGDEAALARLDAAVEVGEVALGLVRRHTVLVRPAPAAFLHARGQTGPSGSRSEGSAFASTSSCALA